MRATSDCWIVRYMLQIHRRMLVCFSLRERHDSQLAGRGRITPQSLCFAPGNIMKAPKASWQFGGKRLNLFEERSALVRADTVDEEDEAACPCDGDKHPGVNSEAEDGRGAGIGAMTDQSALYRPFER